MRCDLNPHFFLKSFRWDWTTKFVIINVLQNKFTRLTISVSNLGARTWIAIPLIHASFDVLAKHFPKNYLNTCNISNYDKFVFGIFGIPTLLGQ